MSDVFRLPRLKTLDKIVDAMGHPSLAFIKFFNTDFAGSIERQEAAQAAVDEAIQEVLAGQGEQLEAIEALQADMATAIEQIQEALGLAQIAQATGNAAQATADEALGAGTVSGSATSPVVDIADENWVTGPQVDLTSVLAGDLTITGSGPLQDDDVNLSGGTIFNGQYRIVEIDGMTETTLFTGSFRVTSGTPATVSNTSAAAVADFLEARTSTGAISYRLDARRTSGVVTVQDLSLYLYARRAA